jgi:hypothetical protein
MTIKVKFLKDYEKHKSGDVAEMDLSEADSLEERGYLEFCKPEPPKAVEPKVAKTHK